MPNDDSKRLRLSIENLSLGFGSLSLLSNTSVEFPPEQLTALIGRNGAGKSTLLRQLAGLGTMLSDFIIINERPQTDYSPSEMARLVAFVGTSRTAARNITVEQAVELGRAPYTDWLGRLSNKDKEIVADSIEMVGVSALLNRRLGTLSDGECQRVMIARALAQQTPILLLDEPTSFLDLPNRFAICRLLATLAHDHGKLIVFSTHELDIALRVCDNIAYLHSSELVLMPTDDMRLSGLLSPLIDFNE